MTGILGQLWLLGGLGALLLVAGYGATGATLEPVDDADFRPHQIVALNSSARGQGRAVIPRVECGAS